MRKEIESEDGLTIIQTTPALSDAVIYAAQKCGISGPYSNEGNDALTGFLYAYAEKQMACPVDFAPWSDNAHATQLLPALNASVIYADKLVIVSVGLGAERRGCETVPDSNTPVAKTRAMRAALYAVVTILAQESEL